MSYMRAFGSWKHGLWMVRLFRRFYVLKAPWNRPLYSERYRCGVTVLPLIAGWRVNIRAITHD